MTWPMWVFKSFTFPNHYRMLARFVGPWYVCFVSRNEWARPGAIPPSMIPTPIPAHLFDSDSDSSHLGYDSDSDSDSNTIFMNDSDSDSILTPALLIFWLRLQNYISSDLNTSPGVYKMCKLFEHYKPYPKQEFKKKFCFVIAILWISEHLHVNAGQTVVFGLFVFHFILLNLDCIYL